MKVQEKIEMLPVGSLVPYARNSRTHSKEQIAQIGRSIREFGFTNPVLIDGQGGIVAGHGRVMAAQSIGMASVPCLRVDWLTEDQKKAYVIADNQLALQAGWDEDVLAAELRELQGVNFDMHLLGFGADELSELLDEPEAKGKTEKDAAPAASGQAVSRTGDVWLLGQHRVMCGDSTSGADVAVLMDGKRAALLHADPPYGMGKEGDGVANDNLYRDKLDAFQMLWWAAFRPHVDDNGSAYVWGNAADLWRLWYVGGLEKSERFELRNEIVWDKSGDPNPTARVNGLPFEGQTAYFSTERCLFLQFGNQFLGSVNAEDFPESWEPLRSYMEGQARKTGLKAPDIKRICDCGMYAHWFTKSQFTLIPEKHYHAIAKEYPGCFLRPWSELRAEWARVRGSGRDVINDKLGIARAYFDNTHDGMTDVWKFPRVTGDDRHGHATPKPVAMMERVMRSSLPPGGLCAEPFGGSGSTLMGAETTGRTCYTMEMQPVYVDVIVRRWQAYTGQRAFHALTGQPFPVEE